MLSKPHRLPAKFFPEINRRGQKIWGDYLFAKYTFLTEPNIRQFGIVVSTKVSPKAVDRNRIKRLISENIRLALPQIKPAVRVVIVALPPVVDKDYHVIKRDILQIINHINRSCPKK